MIITSLSYSDMNDSKYYVNLAKKSLIEILEKEGINLLKSYEKITSNEKITNSDYKKFKEIITEQRDSLKRSDIMLILRMANRIVENDENSLCRNKWNNYITYAINISLLKDEDKSLREFVSGKIWNYQCRQYIQPFDSLIKTIIDARMPRYWDLLLNCELTKEEKKHILDDLINLKKYDLLLRIDLDNSEISEIRNKLKEEKCYEYRARFGDTDAEKILLKKSDSIKSIKEKIDYAKALSIANTDATTKKLIEMLDDTTNLIIAPGVTESVRYHIFIFLKDVLKENELFGKELKKTLKIDWNENDSSKIVVNMYFRKVASWAKEKYNIDLNYLKLADHFKTGYMIPIRTW